MALIPLTQCCLWLGIDAKTLRGWLQAANLTCCLHPSDARLKCLTLPQLQHLAQLHGRPLPTTLPDLAPAPPAFSQACSPHPEGSSPRERETEDEASVRHHLLLLQAQVATLQAQVTELALTLLRNQAPQACLPIASPVPLSPTPLSSSPSPLPSRTASARRAPTPKTKEGKAKPASSRSRLLPLIECRPGGSYVVISPTQGVLPLVPDSAEWFSWLSGVPGFSFTGKSGRFSATRKFRNGERIQSWNIHRSLHGRSCTLYLGLTPTLTLARLEEMAAIAHARLTSR